MRSYRNPFRYRTSEQQQQQGLQRFLRTYGVDVLDLLPEELWDRPLVIRSAPGGGKTSLLRAFSIEALSEIAKRADEFEELHRRMTDLGAIDSSGPLVLGIYTSLSQDFRDLEDLASEADTHKQLFFRFLDARIIRGLCEATLSLVGATLSSGLGALDISPSPGGADPMEKLGGSKGIDLWRVARQAEQDTRKLLDSVLPIDWKGISGHGSLYSVRALDGADVSFEGQNLKIRPLLMFDDGQDLSSTQRTALLDLLSDRTVVGPRWYTERFSALTAEEVIGDGEPGRAYIPLHIERETRKMGGLVRRGRRLRPFEAMLIEIANRRASKPLADYADETEADYSEFLEVEEGSLQFRGQGNVLSVLKQRVHALAGSSSRYSVWIDEAEKLSGYPAALRWRELEIVMTRDRDRKQLELLTLDLTDQDLKTQSDAAIREAAALFLRHEFRAPYYFGAQRIARLASQNIEQFLNVSGNLFEEMLALITLRRRPYLDAASQDRIVRTASNLLWSAIPQRRSYGRDIQHLLLRIASIAQKDTYRSKAPYAPGVTGTAMSMRDRALLLDPETRRKIPGAESLFRSLAGAIGHNLLSADLDRSVKSDKWMVLYLNRLLCARFELPIGYGGFREKSLGEMCSWMAESIPGDLAGVQEPIFEP